MWSYCELIYNYVQLQNQLKLARVACNDLEMHTSQLKMQMGILHEEIKSLSEQLATGMLYDYYEGC